MEKILNIGDKIELCTSDTDGKELLIQSTILDFGLYLTDGGTHEWCVELEEGASKNIYPMYILEDLLQRGSIYPASHSQFMKEYRVAKYINEMRRNDLTFDNPYTDLPPFYLLCCKVYANLPHKWRPDWLVAVGQAAGYRYKDVNNNNG